MPNGRKARRIVVWLIAVAAFVVSAAFILVPFHLDGRSCGSPVGTFEDELATAQTADPCRDASMQRIGIGATIGLAALLVAYGASGYGSLFGWKRYGLDRSPWDADALERAREFERQQSEVERP